MELSNFWAKVYTSEQYKVFSLYDDNIFPFFREFNVFSIKNYFKSWTLQMSLVTKHVSVKLVKFTRVIG